MASSIPSAGGGPVERLLRERLTAALAPIVHIELVNESYKHAVPAGAESHFKVLVVSPAFEGKSHIQRHRLVNDAARGGDAGSALPVHALSISAKTPEQWGAGAGIHDTPNCKGGTGL